MRWKKPKWVSNVQKSAQKAVNTVAAPVKQAVQAIAKAAPPPPPKPTIVQNIQKAAHKVADTVAAPINAVEKGLYKAGDFVAKNTGLDKSPISIPVAPAIKSIIQAPKEVALGVGDVLAGDGSKGLNKIATALMNPAAKTAEVISSPMGALVGLNPINDNTTPGKKSNTPLPPELDMKNKRLPSKNFGTSAETLMDRTEARQAQGSSESAEQENTLSDLAKRQKTNRIASADESTNPGVLESIKKNLEYAGRAVKDAFSEGDDRTGINSRTFYYKYNTVSTKAEQDAFTEAYRRGDKAEMDRIIETMEKRKKGK